MAAKTDAARLAQISSLEDLSISMSPAPFCCLCIQDLPEMHWKCTFWCQETIWDFQANVTQGSLAPAHLCPRLLLWIKQGLLLASAHRRGDEPPLPRQGGIICFSGQCEVEQRTVQNTAGQLWLSGLVFMAVNAGSSSQQELCSV